ncbi:MAG: hypothetical protein IJH65_04980 [Methanobrevibacter sp.]|nr:hypothetical protein [Methanobrevibacter sp.]
MNNRAIDIIASDLKIEKLLSESDSQFFARVVYSAMSQWVKEITIQKCIEQLPNHTCSKASVTRQSSELLGTLFDVFPESKSWYGNGDLIEISRMIRESLESVGDISEIDFESRIAVSNSASINISEESAILLGRYTDGLRYASGLGIICALSEDSKKNDGTRFDEETDRIYEINQKNGDRINDIDGYEMFDPTIKKQALSDCWTEIKSNLMPGEFIIRKKQIHGPGTHLCLRVYKNGLMKASSFDEYLVSSKDYRLHYLRLRAEYNNPIIARIKEMGSYFQLDLFSRLPNYEEEILNYLSWPIGSITNRNNRLFHIKAKDYIGRLLNNIYIQVEYYE